MVGQPSKRVSDEDNNARHWNQWMHPECMDSLEEPPDEKHVQVLKAIIARTIIEFAEEMANKRGKSEAGPMLELIHSLICI